MKTDAPTVPVLGFAAWSGTGKTTLLKKLIPQLRDRGLRVGVVKHAHHDFDIDIPGKDSYELRRVGADSVLVGSQKRWALVVEVSEDREIDLPSLLMSLRGLALDIILVEGLKDRQIPKIELHRSELAKPLLYPADSSIIALASDSDADAPIPRLDLNDARQIADFIFLRFGFQNAGDRQLAREPS